MSNFGNIKVVLFDLGGVLLQLRDPVETFDLHISQREFLEVWLKSESVRKFERGASNAETFGRSIVDELGLHMTWQEFLRRFDSWPKQLFPETPALLDALPAGIGRALLSNTNEAHWNRSDIAIPLSTRLDRTFLSFSTGLLKPDREAFVQVMAAYELPAGAFLFFDDNPLNISAAAAIGMNAALCKSPADALRELQKL